VGIADIAAVPEVPHMTLAQKIAIGIAALLFAYLIWPTPYKEYKSGSMNLRVNRLTGRTEILSYRGWHREY